MATRSESKMGSKNPMYRKHFSEEHRRKISNGLKKAWREGRQRHTTAKYWLGKHHSQKTVEKIREARNKQIDPRTGKKHSEETKRVISNKVKELWENPQYREHMSKAHQNYSKETLRRILTCRRPNKQELILNCILKTNFPKEWKYVGDGRIIIEGKNPDFINVNGKKAIIELFGERWHEPEEEQTRKEVFSKYGYKTLIIWQKELKNQVVLVEKIKSFM